jgi:ribosome assembly protein 1
MFVELVLNNIYKLYNIVIEERNQESVLKACKSLNFSLTKNDMNCLEKEKDSRPLLKTIMRQWLSVPNNIFDCIVNKLPDPLKSIQQGKFDVVFPKYKSLINKNQFFGVVQKLMETGSSESNTIIGFISKMIAVPRRFIGDEVIGPEEDGNEVRFMGKLFV